MDPSTPPRVLAVVLNWNNGAHSRRCAESLLASRDATLDLRIVDNGSADGSPEALASAFGEERLIRLPENLGYCGGMNAGLRHWLERTDAPYALLLTDDVTLEPDAVARMVGLMEGNPGAGATGPVVRHPEPPHGVFAAGGVVDRRRALVRLHREVVQPIPYAVEWIDGCCMLLRREAITGVGLLDERFFIYFEDVDLCLRLARAGWRVMVEPAARVCQEKDPTPTRYYMFYMTRNRFLFFRENFGIGSVRLTALLLLDTLALMRWWLAALLRPSLRHERTRRARWVAAQLRWASAGALAYLRGSRPGELPRS